MHKINLKKQDKILLVLLELSGGQKKNIKFEDIAVAAFKKFSADFHLKGYRNYPDSGDSIKRPLYTLRDGGILIVRNMVFALTDKGLDASQKLKNAIDGKTLVGDENFDRYIQKEIIRIQNLRAFRLFLDKKYSDILDTDFFDYIGTSVKVERMNFKARLKVVEEVNKIISGEKNELYRLLGKFHNFMLNKFRADIKYKSDN